MVKYGRSNDVPVMSHQNALEKSPRRLNHASLTQPDSFRLLDPIGAFRKRRTNRIGATRYSVRRLAWTYCIHRWSWRRTGLAEDHEALPWQHRNRGPIQRTNITAFNIMTPAKIVPSW